MVLKPELGSRCFTFSRRKWIRFLPPVRGSEWDWMMRVEVVRGIGPAFVHPRTFDSDYDGPLEQAARWLRTFSAHSLRTRSTNPEGYRLWAEPFGIAWVVDRDCSEGQRLKVFMASLESGRSGSIPGLAYQIFQEATARNDELGSSAEGQLLYGDITGVNGRLVLLEETAVTDRGDRFFHCSIGRLCSSLSDVIGMLSDEEWRLVCPLEEIVKRTDDDQIRGRLHAYLERKHYEAIFGTCDVGL